MRLGVGLLAAGLLGSAASAVPITVVIGTSVRLATAEPLSSSRHVKGDLVRLTVTEDVRVGETIAIPAGTEAVGQIADARVKGAMGMSGRLVVRPLYVRVGEQTVRLTGSERENGEIEPGAVLGMIALGSAAFTGRSAEIPAGASLRAMVERMVTLGH